MTAQIIKQLRCYHTFQKKKKKKLIEYLKNRLKRKIEEILIDDDQFEFRKGK